MRFLEAPPRFVFFTGKGGVGKTSVACAAALHLARRGKRVLLVSTDPASNVGQVLGVTIGDTVTPIEQVPGLSALEIDPARAAAYRKRMIAPVRGLLRRRAGPGSPAAVRTCTTEIASFNQFTALLADENVTSQYDHIVFDTAPTGVPSAYCSFPGRRPTSWRRARAMRRPGPLLAWRSRSRVRAAVGALKDPAQTRMVLVGRPQPRRWPRSNAPR